MRLLPSLLVGWTTAAFIAASATAVKVGDVLPSIDLHYGFPPENVNIRTRLAKKKALIVGLPGK